jgi:putative mRNA 3-end processing factor
MNSTSRLIEFRKEGIYCPRAEVYIDPWLPVEKALITHAHSDHARYGHQHYLAHEQSQSVMRLRLGQDISLQTVSYGQKIALNGVEISFHPAGHIPGSAQIKLSYKGLSWVISGDYKTEDDGLSTPIEPVSCHTFVTESTFGLPIFQWKPQAEIMEDINRWWLENRLNDLCSVIFVYSLGKAQRILQNISKDIGNVYVHGAIWNTNEALRNDGFVIRKVEKVSAGLSKHDLKGALILAPPSAMGSPWMKKFSSYRTAIASGWMNISGNRRRRSADIGFIISDHADWDGLNDTIVATGAEEVYVTHGYSEVFSRWLNEKGILAYDVKTQYAGEMDD